MGQRHKARIIAFQTIFSWEVNKLPAESLLDFSWADKEYPSDTASFASLLIKGTLERISDIDSLITESMENWDITRISKADLAILRISVYSLKYQTDIPASVTINEAINIAKEYSIDESYRFINGVLDGIKKKLSL